MAFLEIENLSFQYDEAKEKTLNDINLKIEKGTINLLVGASGCGKSTLINLLCGIIPKHVEGTVAGSIHLDGDSILREEPRELASCIGLVFQDPASQFCTYTVRDEIVFSLENNRFSKEKMQERLDAVVELLGLSSLLDMPLNKLSGGEQQRVAVASVLALDPPVMIFDEPTANLDPLATQEVLDIIKRLESEGGRTIIIVEHKLDGLFECVDNVHILGGGEVLFSGSRLESLDFIATDKRASHIWLTHGYAFMNSLGVMPQQYPTPAFVASYLQKQIPSTVGQLEALPVHSMSSGGTEGASETRPPILRAQGLAVARDKEEVLADVSFDVYPGDCLAVVGPNGAGKTTLLYSLFSLLKSNAGTIEINGKDIKKYSRSTLTKEMGMAFQNPEWQFIAYSVEREMEISVKYSDQSEAEKSAAISKYLDFFNLADKREQNPFLLSQGEKRRLSVALTLAMGQEILLLDEPTYGQDPKTQAELMCLIDELRQDGKTIIMVTHDMDLVWAHCNKAVALGGGKVVCQGTPEELFGDNALVQSCSLSLPFWFEVEQDLGAYHQQGAAQQGEEKR